MVETEKTSSLEIGVSCFSFPAPLEEVFDKSDCSGATPPARVLVIETESSFRQLEHR